MLFKTKAPGIRLPDGTRITNKEYRKRRNAGEFSGKFIALVKKQWKHNKNNPGRFDHELVLTSREQIFARNSRMGPYFVNLAS